ncbi:MAG: acetylneuraminic acid synthetase [Lachnospiraceae bacterium]|nr:acetylneuraminic acid synthetase [Lachnospiraceae bacterium]
MRLPYVIAELGVNFYDTARVENITPLEAAKKYIDEAKRVGINGVKFQCYKAETLASKNSPAYWDTSKEPTTSQYELFKKFDAFGKEEYELLCQYCKQKGIDFISTPFDYESVDYLENLVDVYKISSSDISNLPFIRYIAKKDKPIYLSVGASYLSEIEEAVRTIREENRKEICLLHCVLSYPTRNEDANLSIIKSLKKWFPDLTIGYSDHTMPDDSMIILTTAYMYGAEVIEKHFTLDKTLQGNDHYHAGNPEDFKKAICNFNLIATISGNGEKTVLNCEKISRKEARRSLVIKRKMSVGEMIKEEDIICKRPGIGINPKDIDKVIGRCLRYDVEEDTILDWDMI